MRASSVPHIFASNPLDRVGAQRSDEAWLRAQHQDPRGRYLPFRALHVAVSTRELQGLGWLDRDTAGPWSDRGDTILLGLLDGVPHFALPVEGIDAEIVIDGLEFREPRGVATEIASAEAGMLAQGRSMLEWHSTHRFCSQCGSATVAVEGGARRQCSGCDARSYPQVSPSMIVLVERNDRCLLARRARGASNRYSCLAGYVEPGESIEDAVAREVFEESGVRVEGVRYHSSQPWPFPATLMIGCFAEAVTEEVTVDGVEIAEARWFSRDDARRAVAGDNQELTIPDRVAIAHHLIRAWLDE